MPSTRISIPVWCMPLAFTQSWQFVQRPTLVRASAELFLSKSYHLGEARGRRQRKPEWAGNVCVVGEGAPAWREVFTCKGEPQWRHIAWKAGGYGGGTWIFSCVFPFHDDKLKHSQVLGAAAQVPNPVCMSLGPRASSKCSKQTWPGSSWPPPTG